MTAVEIVILLQGLAILVLAILSLNAWQWGWCRGWRKGYDEGHADCKAGKPPNPTEPRPG